VSFGLYLHTPFCTAKCGYCDFYSLPAGAGEVERAAASLLAVTGRLLADGPWRGRPVATLYVGGGTPSLLPAGFFTRLLGAGGLLEGRLAPGAEITVEMNPESVRPAWLAHLASLGVTRASLGVQSFRPTRLAQLDRLHRPGQARRAIDQVRASGIPDLCLDLIVLLPGQDEAELDGEVAELLSCRPEHVSAYGLGFEPGTALDARRREGRIQPLDEERAAPLYLRLSRTLRRAGYQHYEVSNFALPGHAARHNSSYWREEDVLAVGPSAVSAWTEDGRRRRRRFPADWRAFAMAAEEGRQPDWPEEELGGAERWLESLFLGLRWRGGLDLAALEERYGAGRVQALRERARQLGRHGPRERGGRGRRWLERRLFGGHARHPAGPALVLAPEQWLLLDEIVLRLAD
jgi:oxygen-independent coproporphyrinogen-3 oxidase